MVSKDKIMSAESVFDEVEMVESTFFPMYNPNVKLSLDGFRKR